MYRLKPPTIGPDYMILRMNQLFFALFNLGFPFSILQSTYKYKSECEENVFLVSNKISDNPAATPLPPFIYIRRGVLDTTLCDKVCQ
jgi:hypothetical protein